MTRTINVAVAFVSFLSIAICQVSQAATISFQGPIHDSTYIRADNSNANLDNDLDGENIIGRGNAAVDDLRGLFAFNLSSLAAQDIGGGLTINSVTFTMYHRDNGDGGSGTVTFGAHEYAFAFNEGTSTWNNPAGDSSDLTPGGTFGTVLSTVSVTNPSGTADFTPRVWNSTPAFITAVQNALNTDNTLRMLVADISNTGTFDRFYDEDEGLNAPLLQIDFDVNPAPPIPEPSSIVLLGLGMLALARTSRRRKGASQMYA